MKKHFTFAFLVCASTLLTGCQTTPGEISQNCSQKNWNDIGFSDGSQGLAANTTPIKTACRVASAAETPMRSYMEGWNEGIRTYCVPSTGYDAGARGDALTSHCPADLQEEFKSSWLKGIRTFCTASQGFSLGRMNAPYPDYCPLDLRATFRAEYIKGVNIHQNKNKTERNREDIKQKIRLLRIEIEEQNGIVSRYQLNTKLPNHDELVYQHTQYLEHLYKKLEGLQQALDAQ